MRRIQQLRPMYFGRAGQPGKFLRVREFLIAQESNTPISRTHPT